MSGRVPLRAQLAKVAQTQRAAAQARYHRVLVADPPWLFGDNLPGRKRGAGSHYACMTVDDICAIELPRMAAHCWLFLWRPSTHQEEAMRVARAWGFHGPPAELIWRKTTLDGAKLRIGMGRKVRNAHETCLLFTRGKPARLSLSLASVFDAPRLEHSRKPDRFYEIVGELTEGPVVELYARRQWKDWTCLGLEMPQT